MTSPPLVIFSYNRLSQLKKTIASLKKCNNSKNRNWYFCWDGPQNSEDIIACKKIRDYLNSIQENNYFLYFNSSNIGLAKSIISGVTKVLNEYSEAIIIEDDLEFSNNFLDYMDSALKFYNDEKNILSICGYSPKTNIKTDCDIFFGVRSSSWGWATWSDRWKNIDWKISDYKEFNSNYQMKKKFKRGGSDMVKMLNDQMNGKIDSWAIRFCYHQFKYEMACVFPVKSKVINNGFNLNATHTKTYYNPNKNYSNSEAHKFKFRKFKNFNENHLKSFRKNYSLTSRLFNKLQSLLKTPL